jgi:CRP/FNR family cyclic AMP-dependent transcriptional regulator
MALPVTRLMNDRKWSWFRIVLTPRCLASIVGADLKCYSRAMSLGPDAKFTFEQFLEFEDGESIFREGEIGRELFIIQKGSVQIQKKMRDGAEITLATLERGDFFGDMALLQSIPRHASAVARGKTQLLALQPGGFLVKIRRDPTFAFEMIQKLSARLKTSNEKLLEIVGRFSLPADEVQKIISHLDQS